MDSWIYCKANKGAVYIKAMDTELKEINRLNTKQNTCIMKVCIKMRKSRTIEFEKKKLQKKKEENLLVEANQNQLLELFNT